MIPILDPEEIAISFNSEKYVPLSDLLNYLKTEHTNYRVCLKAGTISDARGLIVLEDIAAELGEKF
jgi:hypothetical protein